jgi:hypothetical protein
MCRLVAQDAPGADLVTPSGVSSSGHQEYALALPQVIRCKRVRSALSGNHVVLPLRALTAGTAAAAAAIPAASLNHVAGSRVGFGADVILARPGQPEGGSEERLKKANSALSRAFAELLDDKDVAKKLEKTLKEETRTDELLTQVAMKSINQQAKSL